MIAVAGGPTQGRGQRDDERRVQTCGVGRGEVVGAEDRRRRGHRHARFGQPVQFCDHAVADVAQVCHPFGHEPAEFGEHLGELVHRADHRAYRGRAGGDALLGGGQPCSVLRQGRGGGQHLRGGAGRMGRAVTQPGRDRRCGGVETGGLRGTVRFGHIARVVDGRGQPTRPDHRCVGHAGHHRDATKGRAGQQ